MNVLVIGAGPTGLTLAIDVARRGVPVRIVDRAPQFFTGSRGDSLQPRTLEVLDDLGVLAAVLAEGAPAKPFRVYLDGEYVMERRMFEPVAATPAVPYPNPWMVGQAQLEALLRERLAGLGVTVETGTALTGLTQDETGVEAELSTGETGRETVRETGRETVRETGRETVRADYLVGADGGSSTVRKAVGIAFPGVTDESYRLLLGDVKAPALQPDTGYWFAAASNPTAGAGLTPVAGTDLFQLVTPISEGEGAGLEVMQAILDGFEAGVKLAECTWSTVWRPNVRLAERYRVGRVFLAGDAAHVHPPTGGQGLNTGVQDAYNLGWKLATEADLDSYETERRAVAQEVLSVSTRLLKRYTDGEEGALKRGSEHTGLGITYRSIEDDAKLAPGDRAPDAPVVLENGDHTTLFDLFRGPHVTRLSFGVLNQGIAVMETNRDAWEVDDAVAGLTVTVRPDGYIASISRRVS